GSSHRRARALGAVPGLPRRPQGHEALSRRPRASGAETDFANGRPPRSPERYRERSGLRSAAQSRERAEPSLGAKPPANCSSGSEGRGVHAGPTHRAARDLEAPGGVWRGRLRGPGPAASPPAAPFPLLQEAGRLGKLARDSGPPL
ncbi:hypothetical protein H1C71_008065, partial [Ictidomys tridecemlineatus]